MNFRPSEADRGIGILGRCRRSQVEDEEVWSRKRERTWKRRCVLKKKKKKYYSGRGGRTRNRRKRERERERVVVSGALVRKRAPIIYVDVSGAREKALGIAAERVLAELRGG